MHMIKNLGFNLVNNLSLRWPNDSLLTPESFAQEYVRQAPSAKDLVRPPPSEVLSPAEQLLKDPVKLMIEALKLGYVISGSFVRGELSFGRRLYLKRDASKLAPFINNSGEACSGAEYSVCKLWEGSYHLTDFTEQPVRNSLLHDNQAAVDYVMNMVKNFGYTLVHYVNIPWGNDMPLLTPESFAREYLKRSRPLEEKSQPVLCSTNDDDIAKLYQLDLTIRSHLQLFIIRLYRYRLGEKVRQKEYENIEKVDVLGSETDLMLVYRRFDENIPFCFPPELVAWKNQIITLECSLF